MFRKIGVLFLVALSHLSQAQTAITPEWLWSLGRVSEPSISPDRRTVLYGITYYDLKENKGNRDLYVVSVSGSEPQRLTNSPGSELQATWRPDGKKIGYLSAESGEMQLWEMTPDGGNKRQITTVPGGISGYSYSPDGQHLCYAASVKLDQTLQDKYPDLPKADAALYDGLMYRHWDSWADGHYQHLFCELLSRR